MRFFAWFTFAFFLLASNGCAYVQSKQNELIFHPAFTEFRGATATPAGFEEYWIPVGSEGQKLHAWWSPNTQDKAAPVMLYLHGASVSIGVSAGRIPRWNKMGFSVLAIDYRGFGESSKVETNEDTATEDAEAAYQYMAMLAPGSKRFIYGHSLGGAMATRLSLAHPEASGVILESAFTSIPDMVPYAPWWLRPFGALVTVRFDNLDRIAKIKIPVLIAHGTDDSTVPFAMGEKLFAAANEPKRFVKVDGGSHRNLTQIDFDHYSSAVHEFFGLNIGQNAPQKISSNAKS